MYQMRRYEESHQQAQTPYVSLEARRAMEEAERDRAAREARQAPPKFWWDVPDMRQARAMATAALDTANDWHALIERRLHQAGQLVARVREAQVVHARPDLVEELDDLDLTDLEACLRTVAIVLAEALDRPSAVSHPDDYDAWFRSLTELAEEAGKVRHEVKVAPGPDGRIDGRMPGRALSGVEVRDSAGVMWGAHNSLEVTHLCVVENPVIEIAELVRMAEDGPVFDLSAWLFDPPRGGGRQGAFFAPGDGYWVRIANCTGVSIGNSNTLDMTYTYEMDSCHVNLGLLLRAPEVRADLTLSLDDSPENAEAAKAARQRLPQTVARATGAIDLSRLVPQSQIAAQAAQAQRPRVRAGGGGGVGGLVVSHGAGVVVGLDPSVQSKTVTRIGAFRIR